MERTWRTIALMVLVLLLGLAATQSNQAASTSSIIDKVGNIIRLGVNYILPGELRL